ncbi:ras-related protein Rab-26-like isoform X1 [Scleropages formosus]|uniref:small monomeric GTPase n=1 Tax=Scleropages formosus TaxID=113540 RepID=A0A8C9STA7_SCLFO|nr:ras-related protein Rab-26-like isoform X1 [Scleropages formosus]XP_018618617.2 ras-related protein Rab-26-like isoform X1 [Scleropages formosus]
MSRKKAVKGKSNSSPTACSPKSTGKGKTSKALSCGAESPSNGVVRPSRPSLSNSSEFYDMAFKVMLVGDSGVGKTCLLVRFKDGAFLAGSFISTVGIDFRNKVLNIDGVKVKLQIWDTAGQERFRSVTHAYYRDAHALLLLYDVTNKTSFDNIQAWLTEIHEYTQQDVVLMLLGNKADATHERVVKREEGEKLAKDFGVPFMETSAKSGLNVELAFTAVAKELKHRSMKAPNEPKFKLQDYVNKEMKTSGCCSS